jgi:hypothetical protein
MNKGVRMKSTLFLLLFLYLPLTCLHAADIDQDALKRLDEMGQHLRTLKSFKVISDGSFDVVMDNNQSAEFNAVVKYQVQRPDKLQLEIQSHDKHRVLYYDGKKMTINTPEEKLYGELKVSGPVINFFNKADEYGIETPLADLFEWKDPKGITSAILVEEGKNDNIAYEHFAVRQGKIDWEIWIPKGDKPLPMKVIYINTADATRPRYSSNFTWDLNQRFPASTFDFKPSKDAHKIEIVPAKEK